MISFHYVVFTHFYLQLDVRLVLFILVDWTIVFCFISSWHYFRMIYDLLALKLLYRKTETYMTDIYWFRSVPDCVCLCMYVCLWHVSLRMFNLFTIPLRKIRLKAFATDINNQLAWKCIKKNLPYGLRPWCGWQACCQCMLCQTNRRPSPSQFMYFPWFFILHLFLKVHIRWSNGSFILL
jgi:hypothetical protein